MIIECRRTQLFALMNPFMTMSLSFTILQLCVTALTATVPSLGPGQLLNPLASSNSTFIYDNNNVTYPTSRPTKVSFPLHDMTALEATGAPLPSDPTFEHFHFAAITFFSYGGSVNVANAENVFRQALENCSGHKPHEQMGPATRVYTDGTVSLTFTPTDITYWLTWVLVRAKLVSFAEKYGYPEFSFVFTTPTSSIVLGRGSLKIVRSNTLAPDPCQISFPQGFVKFYNYGSPIDAIDTTRALAKAHVDCLNHPKPAEIIGVARRRYIERNVRLNVFPGRTMIWEQWNAVIAIIRDFVKAFEYVEFNFKIMDEDAKYLASGTLRG